jgi:hypothetical protein
MVSESSLANDGGSLAKLLDLIARSLQSGDCIPQYIYISYKTEQQGRSIFQCRF